MMQVKPYSNITGTDLLGVMQKSNFTGVTGNVYFDAKSDRVGYDFLFMNQDHLLFKNN